MWDRHTKEEFDRMKMKLPQPKTVNRMRNEATDSSKLIVVCSSCCHENAFSQPYAYHAGFGDQGFLYNDEGNLTLIWHMYDKVYSKLFPKMCPWALTGDQQKRLEMMLLPASKGGLWRFDNPARCLKCKESIMGPMLRDICYLKYDNSVDTEKLEGGFSSVLKNSPNI